MWSNTEGLGLTPEAPLHTKSLLSAWAPPPALCQNRTSVRRGGEATADCSLSLCNLLCTLISFPFPQAVLVCCSSGTSDKHSIFPGQGGNEEALVGHVVKILKYILCRWLVADTLIHGQRGRPQVVSIKEVNLGIIKEHARQVIGILL